MDTTAQGSSTLTENILTSETTGCGNVMGGTCGEPSVGASEDISGGMHAAHHGGAHVVPHGGAPVVHARGGLDVRGFASRNSNTLFWVATISVAILILLLILMMFGRLHLGRCSSSFVPTSIVGSRSNFGNYPNWYMQDGCAGYNCSVDTSSGRSLGFGVSGFEQKKSNFGPLPGVRQKSQMVPSNEAQRRAAEELLRKSKMEAERQEAQAKQEHMRHRSHMEPRREHLTQQEEQQRAAAYAAARTYDEVGARQNRVLATCENAWDPMATEEAKVLGAVGVYKANTPGMSSFSRAVNDNVPLTDAQLEAIMQGGEPYTVAPAGINDMDMLSAQQRQEQSMVPPRRFN